MTAVPEQVARLASGYYNSDNVSSDNPGGMDNDGHEVNFPAALNDTGIVAQYVATAASDVATMVAQVDNIPALAAQVSEDRTAVEQARQDVDTKYAAIANGPVASITTPNGGTEGGIVSLTPAKLGASAADLSNAAALATIHSYTLAL